MSQFLVEVNGYNQTETPLLGYLNHRILKEFPQWLETTAWGEHIPFAMFIIAKMEPRRFVELGSYKGSSYCAFCQAVSFMQYDTKCYAIDTWQGDSQAGLLGEDTLTKLRAHNDLFYSSFSTLLQADFDSALKHFEDKSIDLLHIDGFHTYDAVRHDFETWLPKMSDSGIVLFHDTNVIREGFGVNKYWQEITSHYPNFEFLHGNGLGVLSVGEKIPDNIQFLFNLNSQETDIAREFFHKIGFRIGVIADYENSVNELKRLQKIEKNIIDSRLLRVLYFVKEKGIWGYLTNHPRLER